MLWTDQLGIASPLGKEGLRHTFWWDPVAWCFHIVWHLKHSKVNMTEAWLSDMGAPLPTLIKNAKHTFLVAKIGNSHSFAQLFQLKRQCLTEPQLLHCPNKPAFSQQEDAFPWAKETNWSEFSTRRRPGYYTADSPAHSRVHTRYKPFFHHTLIMGVKLISYN